MIDKNLLFIKIRNDLSGLIDCDKIEDVLRMIMNHLSQYNLSPKSTDVVIYDGGDAELLKSFFVAKAAQGLTKASLTYYRSILSQAFIEMGKHIKDIDTDDLRMYLTVRRMKGCKPSSIDNIRRSFSSFFGWLRREGLIDRDPSERIPHIKGARTKEAPLQEEELEKIRLAAKSVRNKAIIEFLYSTACRVSEMTALNRTDIDFEKNKVTVLGKGQKYRDVYISTRCKALLQEYLKERKDDCEALFVSDYSKWKCGFFRDMTPKRLTNDGIRTICHKAGKNAGIDRCHPHLFRKTAATLALKRGMKITGVQKMLGHEDIKTTTIYAITSDEEVKLEHEKFII